LSLSLKEAVRVTYRWRERAIHYIVNRIRPIHQANGDQLDRVSAPRVVEVLVSRLGRNALVVMQAVAFGAAVSQTPAPATPGALPAYRHRLLGVYDGQSGEAIEGAEVIDAFNHVSALTTKTGTITLVFLPDGGSLVQVKKIGYQPVTLLVQISPSDTVPVTVTLSVAAQTLPTVVTKDSSRRYVSPALRAVEERRLLGYGHFLTETELRKHDSEKITNLVRGFSGLKIDCTKMGVHECRAVSVRHPNKYALQGGVCYVDVYVDGVLILENDLEKMPVNGIGAVEYYSGGSTIPLQFNRTGSSCGVLVFWTRER